MTKQSGYQLDAMERAGECFKGLETAWDGAGRGLSDLDKEDAPAALVAPWLDNMGECPVEDGNVLLDVMFKSGSVDAEGGVASSWLWYFEEDDCDYDIVKWRYHNVEDYFKAPRTLAAEGRNETARSSYQQAILENVPADEDEQPKRNKYMREIKPGVWVDCYDVIRAFGVSDPCLQHLLKKALAAGKRHHKDEYEDLKDVLASAKRAVEIYEEWHGTE